MSLLVNLNRLALPSLLLPGSPLYRYASFEAYSAMEHCNDVFRGKILAGVHLDADWA